MNHPTHKEHVINLSVDATTSDEVIKVFDVLSRVATSLALDEVEVRINHFVVEQVCEECAKSSEWGDHE